MIVVYFVCNTWIGLFGVHRNVLIGLSSVCRNRFDGPDSVWLICPMCVGIRSELLTSDRRSSLVSHGYLRRRPLLGLGAEGVTCQALRHLLDNQRHVGGLRGTMLVV